MESIKDLGTLCPIIILLLTTIFVFPMSLISTILEIIFVKKTNQKTSVPPYRALFYSVLVVIPFLVWNFKQS